MTAPTQSIAELASTFRIIPPVNLGRSMRIVERNRLVSQRLWWFVLAGLVEPIVFLFSMRVGLGDLIGQVEAAPGKLVDYATFVAPGLLAASAMNGAVSSSTFGIYGKLRWQNVYTSIVSTPLSPGEIATGEVVWAQMQGGLYAGGFLLVMTVMGLVTSWWAVLALPAALLVGFAFAACGLWATTYLRSWQDFEFIAMATLPMFLFSTTFYPLAEVPEAVQWFIRATPLYQGVAMLRALVTGVVDWSTLGHAAYLLIMGLVGWRRGTARFQGVLGE